MTFSHTTLAHDEDYVMKTGSTTVAAARAISADKRKGAFAIVRSQKHQSKFTLFLNVVGRGLNDTSMAPLPDVSLPHFHLITVE